MPYFYEANRWHPAEKRDEFSDFIAATCYTSPQFESVRNSNKNVHQGHYSEIRAMDGFPQFFK